MEIATNEDIPLLHRRLVIEKAAAIQLYLWSSRVAKNKSAPNIPATILDPFCGSGTTGFVSGQLGRLFIGIDLSAKYLAENALPRSEGLTSLSTLKNIPAPDSQLALFTEAA